MIREMRNSDSTAVTNIYKQGIESKNATFETEIPDWNTIDGKYHKHSRFVYEENKNILGWITLSPVSSRNAYRGVAEVSVYVHDNAKGKGIGTALMNRVIESSEENGIWTLYANFFPENEASIKLHLKFGFRKIGTRGKIACLNSVWRDTLIMERRSKVIGV